MKKFIFIFILSLSLFAHADVTEVRVLLYHAIDASYGEAPSQFYQEIDFLYNNGYNTITLDEFYNWHQNNISLPNKSIVLTFDDNYISMYDVVYPYLQSKGFMGTNFTHTNYVGVVTSYDHCDWTEINEMESAGVMYTESHTKSHLQLTTLSDAEEIEELQGSKTAIENNIPGKTCKFLAYPYGDYDSDTILKAQSAGYWASFTTISEPNTKSTPLHELNRIAINPGDSLETFKDKIGYTTGEIEDLIVDNMEYGSFQSIGTWELSTSEPNYYGTNYAYHASGTGDGSATFSFNITESGTYEVFAWWTSHSNRALNAPYTINHSSGSNTVRVDQTTNGGEWNSLGTYFFSEGTATVVLSNDADGYVIADAVKMELKETNVSFWMIY